MKYYERWASQRGKKAVEKTVVVAVEKVHLIAGLSYVGCFELTN